jgi:hypothetical protein
MKKLLCLALMSLSVVFTSHSQEARLWTDADRKYLLENLGRSRDELLNETKGLTKEQWTFKESPDRWSINEIVEHIATWELLLDYRISRQLRGGAQLMLAKNAIPDSLNLNFIMEEKNHIAQDYTKPYTYTLPMGLNDLLNNVSWFLKMRNESIDYVTKTTDDLRVFYVADSRANTHQTFITLFGHTDRHIRQIKKVKQHPGYPKTEIRTTSNN